MVVGGLLLAETDQEQADYRYRDNTKHFIFPDHAVSGSCHNPFPGRFLSAVSVPSRKTLEIFNKNIPEEHFTGASYVILQNWLRLLTAATRRCTEFVALVCFG